MLSSKINFIEDHFVLALFSKLGRINRAVVDNKNAFVAILVLWEIALLTTAVFIAKDVLTATWLLIASIPVFTTILKDLWIYLNRANEVANNNPYFEQDSYMSLAERMPIWAFVLGFGLSLILGFIYEVPELKWLIAYSVSNMLIALYFIFVHRSLENLMFNIRVHKEIYTM